MIEHARGWKLDDLVFKSADAEPSPDLARIVEFSRNRRMVKLLTLADNHVTWYPIWGLYEYGPKLPHSELWKKR